MCKDQSPVGDDDFDDEWVDESFDDELLSCPSCGSAVHEDTQKCPACGDWIVPIDRSDKTKSAIWTVAVVMLILAFLAFTLR